MDVTVVRGANLLDGSGSTNRRADILVRGTTIEAVEAAGALDGVDASVVLDAAGATLTPGFIDVHSHADNAPLLAEDDTSKILQGVTTEVVGNCGFSLAPHLEETGKVIEDYSGRFFPPLSWSWGSFAELLEVTDGCGYVTNYAPLVGHHALRIAAMGMADRAPTTTELDRMGGLLQEACQAGAFGLSSGLIYPPGVFSETDELVALASRLPDNRIYTTHMRGEGGHLLASIAEALRIGEESGRPVQVSHLKASGRPMWGSMGDAIEMLDAGRSRGLEVRHDVYPYTASSTMLTAILPRWFQEGGDTDVMRRLTDKPSLARLRADLGADDDWANLALGTGWDGVVISSSPSHRFDGRSVQDIADSTGADPVDAAVDVLLAEQLKVTMVMYSMHEDDLVLALEHPDTMIGSDGLPPGLGGKPHPRMYGTFPRVLSRYVRDRKVLSLPEAVRKMTSLPASTFGLRDRGLVEPRRAADLVLFDPGTVVDRADYDDPVQPPAGISWVMQNGRIVARDGQYLGGRAGRRLTPSAA
jgi:N-acyl-D-aspartate/D-glutamate deacylase